MDGLALGLRQKGFLGANLEKKSRSLFLKHESGDFFLDLDGDVK